MAWDNPIPPAPDAVQSLGRRVVMAWEAAHTILNAFAAWEQWLALARAEYREKERYDVAKGDAICRDGATAIRALCGLGLRGHTFVDDGGALIQEWPKAPSDKLDLTWYVSGESTSIRQRMDRYRFWFHGVLEPKVRQLLQLLERCPEAAFDRGCEQRGPVALSDAENDIMAVLREIGPNGDRSQTAILNALSERGKCPSEGTTKNTLAALVRHGILLPRYRLPEWGN